MLTESDSRDGEGVRGVQGWGSGGWGNRRSRERAPRPKGEGQRPDERRAEERAFTLMDGLSSSGNQKPNPPGHLLARAVHGANCAVI